MQGVGALVYGLGANEPTCTPQVTPLTVRFSHPPGLSQVLSEPNTATCTENVEWKNQTQDLSMCMG